MAGKSKSSDTASEKARANTLKEAAQEAQRLAREWRDEADGPRSSHNSDLRRIWADAAEKVADAIVALKLQGGSSDK